MKYRRILLKLSGEALVGNQSYGIDHNVVALISDQIKNIKNLGIEIALVVGGGNIFRGVTGSSYGMDRVAADHIGMLATIMNALTLQDILEQKGIDTCIMSSIDIPDVAEKYIRRCALRHIEKGRVVIFAAGTGDPYFTTDTAAALRGIEINAEILMKATNVDGIYTSDPKKDKLATKYEHVNFQKVLEKNLKVMDATAIALCRENNLPILVFNMTKPDNLLSAINGNVIGTLVD